jgi:S1-C subfamily serine protease
LSQAGVVTNRGKIGVRVEGLTAEKARPLGYAENAEGVLIADVESDGVASGAGLRRGILILQVDHQKVKTVQGSPEGS